MSVFRLLRACAMVSFISSAIAQPSNPVDLGVIPFDGSSSTPAAVQMTPGRVVWYKFRLAEAMNQFKNWIDIDTGASTFNTEIGLYDERGNRLAVDEDSGEGNGAGMSLGAGSGNQLGQPTTSTSNDGGRISDGQWVYALPPGVYYLGVSGQDNDNETFQNLLQNWDQTNNHTETGSTQIRVTSGVLPRSHLSERFNGLDSGDLPSTAIVPKGSGTLGRIVTSFQQNERDTFKIRVCSPLTFSASIIATDNFGTRFATRVFLFNALGQPVFAVVGNTGNQDLTTVPTGSALPAGEYFMTIQTACGGVTGVQPSPYDSSGNPLFTFPSNTASNTIIRPNASTATNQVAYFGQQTTNCANGRPIVASVTLTGACYVEDVTPGCPADLGRAGGLTGADGSLDNNDFVAFINLFFTGCP